MNIMKKYFNYAFAGAIALLGTYGFTACSSSEDSLAADEQAPVSEKYNPATGEVGVDFVMNVAANNGTTRMTAANTQATLSEAFRGIDKAYLMTFALASDGSHVGAAQSASKNYSLGNVLTAGYLDPDGTGSTPKSRRVLELALPTGTNALMFWGKAIKDGTDNAQGKVTWNISQNLAETSIELGRRIPADNTASGQTAFGQYQDLMAKALTKIVQAQTSYDVTYDAVNKKGTLKWSDYVTVSGTGSTATMAVKTTDPSNGDVAMCPLGEILGNAFYQMNKIYDREQRAGSGKAVALMIGDLALIIAKVSGSTPTSMEEAIAKAVGLAVQTAINTFFSNATSNCQWQAAATVKTNAGWTPSGSDLVGSGNLNEFPSNFNVPEGAAILGFTIHDGTANSFTYSYKSDIPSYAMSGESLGTFNVFNYRYPAELCYFGNSPVRVSNTAHITSEYPDGASNWENGSWTTDWTANGKVLSTTRSVAMQHNINYGTALMRTTVKFGASELKDNNKAIQQERKGVTEDDQSIDVTSGGLFTLTGVLIGGVEATMGWNYIAKEATPTFSNFIYDKDIPNTAIPAYGSGSSQPVYTLVWDNWNQANKGSEQNDVYIALEFVNNTGKDFWGWNNLIRNGATFYITGKLDPDVTTADKLTALGKTAEQYAADKSLGITWPTNYALPPYDESGNTIKERRVFIQDFTTTADFVIGATSLQKALVALPDLRSTQISLGLSVDLEWSKGLDFGDVTLGN